MQLPVVFAPVAEKLRAAGKPIERDGCVLPNLSMIHMLATTDGRAINPLHLTTMESFEGVVSFPGHHISSDSDGRLRWTVYIADKSKVVPCITVAAKEDGGCKLRMRASLQEGDGISLSQRLKQMISSFSCALVVDCTVDASKNKRKRTAPEIAVAYDKTQNAHLAVRAGDIVSGIIWIRNRVGIISMGVIIHRLRVHDVDKLSGMAMQVCFATMPYSSDRGTISIHDVVAAYVRMGMTAAFVEMEEMRVLSNLYEKTRGAYPESAPEPIEGKDVVPAILEMV